MVKIKPVLRVAVLNNFNFTDAEIEALTKYEEKYNVFVNSNGKTTIRSDYPSIVTINPDLFEWVAPNGDLSSLKAVRIKYVHNAVPEIKRAFEGAVNWALNHNIPILYTIMRFRTKADLRLCTINKEGYVFRKTFFRLNKELYPEIDNERSFGCDYAGKGCPSCGNCARLTYGKKTITHGLDLSASGYCPYNCISCYAKILIKKNKKILFDKVKQNDKQKGKVNH